MNPDPIEFTFFDFTNTVHRSKFIELLNQYITDPMGGGESLDEVKAGKLLIELSEHPSSFVLFVLYQNTIAGLATCFINYSTFRVAPYLNIHDLIIHEAFRRKGLARLLLEKIIDIARERSYCKVTLEVRDDNYKAKKLYRGLGFGDTEPMMHFWTKML